MGIKLNSNKWVFFSGSWSGNYWENLFEYATDAPFAKNLNVCVRREINLFAVYPRDTGDTITRSGSGRITSKKEKCKFLYFQVTVMLS